MKQCSLSSIAKALKAADNIAVAAHINPDGDAFGSVLGLGMALKKLGKNVHMYIDDEVPPQFKFLPGIAAIKRPPAEEVFQAGLLVILDASDCERLGSVCRHVNAPLIMNIDHHVSNKGFAELLFLDVKAAATCEIIFHLVKELGVQVDKELATVLYTGIVTDCGFFRYANTTSATMKIAAELLETGISPNEIADFLELQTVENLRVLPKVLETLSFDADGMIASISISVELYNEEMDSDAFVKYPRYIEGVEVAVLFKGVALDKTRVSMRSRKIDVSSIAVEYGGGGHARASGCTIEGNIEKARIEIISAIKQHLGVIS